MRSSPSVLSRRNGPLIDASLAAITVRAATDRAHRSGDRIDEVAGH